jgi:cell division protein FtsB
VKALALGTGLIGLVVASALLDGETGVAIWLELRESLVVSNQRVAALERETEALRLEIETIEAQPSALDRVIREELDLALPGETVVYFTGADAGQGSRGILARRQDSRPGPIHRSD